MVVGYLRMSGRRRAMASVADLRRSSDRPGGRPSPPARLRLRVAVSSSVGPGFAVHHVRSRRADSGRRIVYLHGGSFVREIAVQHWKLVAVLAQRLHATVHVPLYPLAPEHTWRDSAPELLALIRRTTGEAPRETTVVGDSAGASMALSLAQQLAAGGGPVPPLVLISPLADVTFANPRCRRIAAHDPWLAIPGLQAAVGWWAGDDDPTRPEVSPGFGSFAGLTRIQILTGTRDLLNPQAHDIAERARAAGAHVDLVEQQGLVHDYPLLPIPEARRAVAAMVDFIAGTDTVTSDDRAPAGAGTRRGREHRSVRQTDDLLENARRYAAGFGHGGRPPSPARHVAVLTCMDARLHPERLLGLEIGDAHVIRNAGGRASGDALRSLILSSRLLGTREYLVIHHTDCGLLGLSNDELCARLAAETGVDASDLDFLAFSDLEDSVRDDLRRIRESPFIPGDVTVTGYVYDVDTGRLRPVEPLPA